MELSSTNLKERYQIIRVWSHVGNIILGVRFGFLILPILGVLSQPI